MSAWLCSDKHIFELAKYYVDKCQTYSSSKLSFKEAAKLLHEENVKSLQYRYDDADEFFGTEAIRPPMDYAPTIRNIFALAKQVDCYTYQACEHPEWENSKAFAMCESIKDALLRNHPDYEDAPWGID
jgi:hypothetical protein